MNDANQAPHPRYGTPRSAVTVLVAAFAGCMTPASEGVPLDLWPLRDMPYQVAQLGHATSVRYDRATAELARLPDLADVVLPPSHREVRLWAHRGGPTIPDLFVRLTDQNGEVHGEAAYYWQEMGEAGRPVAGRSIVRGREARSGRGTCRMARAGMRVTIRHLSGREVQTRQLAILCRVPLRLTGREWSAELSALEALDVFTLQTWIPRMTSEGIITVPLDGSVIVGQTLVADHYAEFYWPNPEASDYPEAGRADAILRRVLALGERR